MARPRGTITKRARGYYAVASVTDPMSGRRHRPRVGPFDSPREARAGLDQLLADISARRYTSADRTPLGDYLTDWLGVHRTTLKPSTAHGYASVIDRYVGPIAAVALSDLRPSHLNALYAGMVERGLSPRTVRTVHVVVRRALADALRDGIVVRNVAVAASLPRTSQPNVRVWTAEELRTFLASVADHPLYPAFHVAAFTGIRRAELCGLRWDAVELENAKLHITRTVTVVGHQLVWGEPKTTRGRRVVDRDASTVAVLRRWRIRQGPDADRVFDIHPAVLTRSFARAVHRAGVPVINWHALRHGHVTHLLAAGVQPHVVAARVGHATVGFTLSQYAHVMPTQQTDAAEAFAAAVLGTSLSG
jgi:integrase